ncbi:glutathione gamma-glutamylcysteinyltransferase 3-like isoform X2 [Diospyros lotus]|uniref:glutathione gamma-glutamylcysteinyltransferase 3-like isoform X2 n=1 Tax=Diospyros lotus TaxID=55363 RepID=UPI0022552115|nr:glutathione gamma-glutamylcysteinyltransferase 3-like isoform X2 [Diospyros lotus]
MAVATFYRRVLPSPPAIDFASPEGEELFVEALSTGSMEGFFKLISYYQTQSEPAYCGLASLAMVLNSLAIDPGRKWKGPWRWFDDSMLDCCEPLGKIKEEGISFGKVVCLAYCNGGNVEAFRANESTIDHFRSCVVSCAASQDCHMITSYHREKLEQTGTGHFSPIGGYHAGRDMVLILDVARFKYPPHWIPLSLLWEAMNTIDNSTGHYRGFMILSRLENAPSILYTVSCKDGSWISIMKYLIHDVPFLLKSEDIKDVQELLFKLIASLPSDFNEFIKWAAEVRRSEDENTILSEEEKKRLELKGEVLKQVQETELFAHVTRWLASESSNCKCITSLSNKTTLPEIAANVCHQGAQLLSGKSSSSNSFCFKDSNTKLLEGNGQNSVRLISGTVIIDGGKQRVDMLIPWCQRGSSVDSINCSGMHPSTADVLTVLLLALPEPTWSDIENKKLRAEMNSLTQTENLPLLLQEESMQTVLELDSTFIQNLNKIRSFSKSWAQSILPNLANLSLRDLSFLTKKINCSSLLELLECLEMWRDSTLSKLRPA